MVVTVLYQEARVFWLCPFSSCSFLKFPIPSQVGCYFGIILKMNISRSLYYSKAHYTWEQSILGMNLHLTRARASPVPILETKMNSKSNAGHTKHLLGERSALSPFMKNEQLIFPPSFSFPFLFSLSPFPLHPSPWLSIHPRKSRALLAFTCKKGEPLHFACSVFPQDQIEILRIKFIFLTGSNDPK